MDNNFDGFVCCFSISKYCRGTPKNSNSILPQNGMIYSRGLRNSTVLLITMDYFLTVWDLDFTHWGRVTHIYFSKLTISGSDNGLSPGRHQTIIWTRAGILLTVPTGQYSVESESKFIHFHPRKFKRPRRPAQRVLCRIALPTTTAQTV